MSDVAVPDGIAAGDLVYRTLPDIRFTRAEGIRLYDSEGREYLDAEAANGTLSWGYNADILREACQRVLHMPGLPSFCESELRLNVVRRLAERFDCAVGRPGRVAVELGGAQGIEMAMRIVAANRGSRPILTFQGGYHGRSPFTAHLSASSRYRRVQPWPGPEVIRLPYPDCASCAHRPAAGGCNPGCAATTERLGVEDVFGVPGVAESGVGALVIEPLLNVGGFVLPDSEHLRRVVAHVRSLGGLIVLDEVFTGLHRLGPEWGFQLHEIEPDIVVASKALTNGITAFSCVWAREPLAAPDVFTPGSHSSTFAGNPHSLAVVETVLDRWDGWPNADLAVAQLATDLTEALQPLLAQDVVRAVRVDGGLARVDLTGPYASQLRRLASLPTGDRPALLLASTGMALATVALHPPLVITRDEVHLIADVLAGSVKELERHV